MEPCDKVLPAAAVPAYLLASNVTPLMVVFVGAVYARVALALPRITAPS